MSIIFSQNKKMYVVIKENEMIDFSDKLTEASDMDHDKAVKLVARCSKKLKSFEVFEREFFVTKKTPRRSFSAVERKSVYVRDRGICGICGKFVPPDEYTVDHIVPISKGGTYDLDNLQCCCHRCNYLKNDLMPDTFFENILDILKYQVSSGNAYVKQKIKESIKEFFSFMFIHPILFYKKSHENPEI